MADFTIEEVLQLRHDNKNMKQSLEELFTLDQSRQKQLSDLFETNEKLQAKIRLRDTTIIKKNEEIREQDLKIEKLEVDVAAPPQTPSQSEKDKEQKLQFFEMGIKNLKKENEKLSDETVVLKQQISEKSKILDATTSYVKFLETENAQLQVDIEAALESKRDYRQKFNGVANELNFYIAHYGECMVRTNEIALKTELNSENKNQEKFSELIRLTCDLEQSQAANGQLTYHLQAITEENKKLCIKLGDLENRYDDIEAKLQRYEPENVEACNMTSNTFERKLANRESLNEENERLLEEVAFLRQQLDSFTIKKNNSSIVKSAVQIAGKNIEENRFLRNQNNELEKKVRKMATIERDVVILQRRLEIYESCPRLPRPSLKFPDLTKPTKETSENTEVAKKTETGTEKQDENAPEQTAPAEKNDT